MTINNYVGKLYKVYSNINQTPSVCLMQYWWCCVVGEIATSATFASTELPAQYLTMMFRYLVGCVTKVLLSNISTYWIVQTHIKPRLVVTSASGNQSAPMFDTLQAQSVCVPVYYDHKHIGSHWPCLEH